MSQVKVYCYILFWVLDEATLQQHYQDALDELRYELDGRISAWVRIAKKYYTK